MSIKDRLFSIFNSKKKVNVANDKLEVLLNHFYKTYPITKNPIVLSIIHQVSSTISTLGLDLYQRSKTGSYKSFSNPTALLMAKPNSEDCPTQFLYRLTYNYLMYGNIYIHNLGGSLQILDPLKMTVTRSSSAPYVKVYHYDGSIYTDNDILHIYNPQYYDNYIGHSPIEYNRELLELHSALLLYIKTYFNNSAGNRITITLDSAISEGLKDEAVKKQFEEWLQSKVVNPTEAGSTILLKSGMTLGEIKQSSNAEAELSSLFERVEKQICKVFGFPYYMLSGDYGNNLQYQQINYLQTSIMPITEIFQEKFNTLLALSDAPFMFFKFDFDNLLMPDTKTKHEILRSDIAGSLITIDEARAEINKDMYSGDATNIADTLFVMSNLIPALNKHLDLYFANAVKQLKDNLTNGEQGNPNTK